MICDTSAQKNKLRIATIQPDEFAIRNSLVASRPLFEFCKYRTGLREFACFHFRVNQLAVDRHFKRAAFRWNQRQRKQRTISHALDDFFRQPDGLWFVVSLRAVFDLNFDHVPSLLKIREKLWADYSKEMMSAAK